MFFYNLLGIFRVQIYLTGSPSQQFLFDKMASIPYEAQLIESINPL